MSQVVVLRTRFGNRVKSLLMHTGMAIDDLAELSRLPPHRVERIIEGNYIPITISDMESIASALGISLHSLLAPPEPTIPVAPTDTDGA